MIKKLCIIFLFFLPVYLSAQNIDIRLLRSFNSPVTLPSDNFFRFVSNSNAYIVIGIPAGLATAGLIQHDDKLLRNACVIVYASVVNAGITTAMKYLINRDRPFITYTVSKKLNIRSKK